ncbi:MAG: Nramp family divalent metal transporter [Patescibacteria group bacterium]
MLSPKKELKTLRSAIGKHLAKRSHTFSRELYKTRRSISHFFVKAKDGVITGSADNDPAGVVTYAQAGASFGFRQLWVELLSLPLLVVVEEMSARVGVVTKHGLNAVISRYFGFSAALLVATLVATANTATIGADLASMAEALGLITGVKLIYFVVPLGLVLAFILIVGSYAKISRFFALLTPLFLLYVASSFLAHPNWGAVLKGFLPHVEYSAAFLGLVVALLGTTISPYLIFWQTTEEVEEKKTVGKLREEEHGVVAGMAYSQAISAFITIATGAVLFGRVAGGQIETAAQAARALEPLAGQWSALLFAAGIIVSGALAIPILAASTAYVVADAFHFAEGLNLKLVQARWFYAVMTWSMVFGIAIALLGISPLKMLIYSQILNGFLMPFLLVVLLKVTSRKDIMGQHTNSPIMTIGAVITIVVFVVSDILLVLQWLK